MKNESGAITLYVSIACLFVLIIGISNYIIISNKQAAQLEQLDIIEESYSTGTTLEDEYKNFTGGEIIPIETVENLQKIGTGEQVYINGKIYTFTIDSTYVLENDFEFTGSYRETASRIKENKILIEGNGHQIIVTNTNGVQEYYTENSKYYIATNKYGYVLDGLILYYDGIDNTGTGEHSQTTTTWKDLSGNGNDGTLNSFGNNIISGWGKNYLAFDGINDWVNCGVINNDYATLEIGYVPKVKDNIHHFIMGNWHTDGIGIALIENKRYGGGVYNDGYKTVYMDNNTRKNEFNTITLSYDGAKQNGYINGILKASISHIGTIGRPTDNTVMAIGVNPYKNTSDLEFNNMKAYTARIYNRALTSEEVEVNSKADKRRFDNDIIIPIYTAEQLVKIGTNTEVYISQEKKKYTFTKDAKYVLKSDITLTTDFSNIATKIKNGEIELQGEGYKIIDSNSNYYTEASDYCVAVNKYGYIANGLLLHYDAIDNTGSGHSNSTTTWKDLSGNGNDATVSGTYTWKDNELVFEEGAVGKVVQNGTWSGITSFTLNVSGKFSNGLTAYTWPRIVSTNGEYNGVYDSINGIDYAISGNWGNLKRHCSDGNTSNSYGYVDNQNVGKNVVINANWNYATNKLLDNRNACTKEDTITKFDNINVNKISMAHNRTTESGQFCYNSVRFYNRSLTDEEMSINNRNDRIRFNFEYWS